MKCFSLKEEKSRPIATDSRDLSRPHNVWRLQKLCHEEEEDSLNTTKMVTNSEEIDLTLKLSLDKPHTENAENLLTRPSLSICGHIISKSLVGNGACERSSVSSLYEPRSLQLKAEKIEFQDLQKMGRPKDVKVKRLMLQKQNKVEAAKIKKKMSPLDVPSEVIARAAASVAKNPAFIRALAQIKEDLKLLRDLKHKSARGLSKGGATSRFLRSPKEEKVPTKASE